MTRPKPIRYDVDTWFCMRNDPEIPKAVIERRRDAAGHDVFLVSAWSLNPAERVLMRTAGSLEKADALVRWDVVKRADKRDGPPNGIGADGVQRG